MVVLSANPDRQVAHRPGAQEQLAGESHGVVHYQCLPYHRNSRLQAAIEELEHTASFGRDDDQAAKRAKLEAHLHSNSIPAER